MYRAAKQLAISTLEIAIIAFVSSSAIEYGLWWFKAKDFAVRFIVEHPNPALLLHRSTQQIIQDCQARPSDKTPRGTGSRLAIAPFGRLFLAVWIIFKITPIGLSLASLRSLPKSHYMILWLQDISHTSLWTLIHRFIA
jgi:hypothetical protein